MNVLMVLKCILNKHKCKLQSVQLHLDLDLKCVFKSFAETIQPCGTGKISSNLNLSKPVLVGQNSSDPFKMTGKHWSKWNWEHKSLSFSQNRTRKSFCWNSSVTFFHRGLHCETPYSKT